MSSEHDPYRTPEDDEPPTLTPWHGVWIALSAAFLSWFLVILLSGLTGRETPTPGLVGVGVILGYGAALALAHPLIQGPPGPALGFVASPARVWWVVPLFIPSVLLMSELENILASVIPRAELSGDPVTPTGWIWHVQEVLSYVVAYPIASEILLRGLLQPRLVPLWGSRLAVVGTAALGTLWYLPGLLATAPGALIVPFGYGCLQGLLRRASGSIFPGLALGMAFAGTQVAASQEAFGIQGFDLIGGHTPLSTLVLPAVLLGVGLSLCRGEAPDAVNSPGLDGSDRRS